jgi:addiction module HigA family antidote
MFKNHFDDLDRAPLHPGEVLREDVLPHIEMSRSDLARHLGISTDTIADLIAERRPVTLDLARRLGIAFGQGAHYWLGLQAQHDQWLATAPVDVAVRPITWKKRRRDGKARRPAAAI